MYRYGQRDFSVDFGEILKWRLKDLKAKVEAREVPTSCANHEELAQLYTERGVSENTIKIEEDELKKTETALKSWEDGSFGICAKCQREISEERLLAAPHAQHCCSCSKSLTKKKVLIDVQLRTKFLSGSQFKLTPAFIFV